MATDSKIMTEKSLKKLEYDVIIELLAQQARTSIGRMLCRELLPAVSLSSSLEGQEETNDAFVRLVKWGDLPFGGIDDIRPIVRQASAGATLDCGELLKIASFLRAVDRMLDAVDEHPHDLDEADESAILRKARMLESLPGFLRRLEMSVAGEDELFDHASEELYRIRRRLRDAQDAVKKELDKVLLKHAGALQENLITMRSGRYVVPVRSDRRAAVRGLVHDTSASGNTLFIEPMAVVELNNKIRELEAAEQHEILSILKELSAIAASKADVLLTNTTILAELDFAMSKARLALAMDAIMPLMNDSGVIVLRKARHPLIPTDRVVPIDFELGKTFRTLVITGPNTGGKTVTLKTCGLLTLMAMAGLFIPARSPSEISWFKSIEVDIGDEQSIEQNLSTFSSHMREVIRITEIADEGVLVLLDELGAGTDPSEGAALAIAILDHLRLSGCHTVATTHYRELKGYAMNETGVENACCEFDTETLQPTYKLLIGVPGVSNAFAISSRLGLDGAIIDRARALISDEGTRFENLVSAIEQSHREARAMEEEIGRLREETVRAKETLEKERDILADERERLLSKARDEAASLLDETRAEIDLLLEEMRRETMSASAGDHRVTSEARGRLAAIEKKYKVRPSGGADAHFPINPVSLRLGELYEARSLGVSGVLRELPDSKDQVVLESGSFKVTVPVSELRYVRKQRERGGHGHPSKIGTSSKLRSDIVMRAKTELMLLGKRVDEAVGEIDQFLDDALLAGLSPVRIVHGKGTGALRKATHDYLMRDRRVKSFRAGGDGEGGDGVTVAELYLDR